MDYLPLFFDLKDKPVLLVGGGEIATRKARLLASAGANIHVVAPVVSDELKALVSESGLIDYREFSEDDIQGKCLVVSATDNEPVNARVAQACHAINLPVNVVDSPELCSVITPAIVDRSPLIIAVTSGGESPVLARRVRAQLESVFPAAYGELAKLASRYRDKVKNVFKDGEIRRRFWESVLNGSVAEKALTGNLDEADQELQQKINDQDVSQSGEVYLVGAGPGDPDLLTFKALRLMQQAEVVLYDRLVSKPILDMTRRDADRIYVGKKRDYHSIPQDQINQLIVDHAKAGRRVLRLKGGDPFIFGRGAEELDLLVESNIPFQVVPGITAASGCASYAGIPLTHRDHSQSVRFITGHLKQAKDAKMVLDYPWSEFVATNQTLVFYMGLTAIETICGKLIEHGRGPDTPAALIERGTMPEQTNHIATLEELPRLVKEREIHAPTLLIIGDVVNLHNAYNWYKK